MQTRALSLAAALLFAASVAQPVSVADTPSAKDWDYSQLYEQGGIRAESLLNAVVVGADGVEIGDVENAVVDARGRMVGIIARVGGIWDVGDRLVAVPFEQLRFSGEGVEVPITQDNVDEFDLYGDDSFVGEEDLQPDSPGEPGHWKVTDLLHDYAIFPDSEAYGHVADVLFSRRGEIQAVVIQTGTAYPSGQFAYPFDPENRDWMPAFAAFTLPYDRAQAAALEPFRYDRYDSILG